MAAHALAHLDAHLEPAVDAAGAGAGAAAGLLGGQGLLELPHAVLHPGPALRRHLALELRLIEPLRELAAAVLGARAPHRLLVALGLGNLEPRAQRLELPLQVANVLRQRLLTRRRRGQLTARNTSRTRQSGRDRGCNAFCKPPARHVFTSLLA